MLSDPKKTKDEIIQWIRDYFAENGTNCSAVVGISGGKDSSIVAALCAEALGANRVFGVMMPDGEQPDIETASALLPRLVLDMAVSTFMEQFRLFSIRLDSIWMFQSRQR